jgi:hypothetical protein
VQVAIIVILLTALVTAVIPFFSPDIFILGARGGEINIVGCLTGLVCRGATAEGGYDQCQK